MRVKKTIKLTIKWVPLMALFAVGFAGVCSARIYVYQEPALLRMTPNNGLWTDKFNDMSSWSTSRGRMDMQYITRGMVLDFFDPSITTSNEMTEIVAFMQTQTVVMDYLDPYFTVSTNRQDTAKYDALVSRIENLYNSGIVVHTISMQSFMSKPKTGYTLAQRVEDAQFFADYMNTELSSRGVPTVSFALSDASRALGYSDWQDRLRLWVRGMRTIGEEPDHILHDFPATYVVDQNRPADLKQAMTYCLGTLVVDSGWWICSGNSSLTPRQARNLIMDAISKLQTITGWSGVTKYVMWGDFRYNFSSDSPDVVNGAPYTALEVFNEIYNEIQ